MIGKIRVEECRIPCSVGVYEHEKEIKQDLLVSVEVEGDFTQCVLSDSIADTLDYEKVVEVLKELVAKRHYHLIETFCFEALNVLFDQFPEIRYAKICVKKPSALKEARYASIEFEKWSD